MPNCNGGWVGDGGGTWTGTFDDSNMITLQRETADVCNDITINVGDIKQQVFGAYGFQASWDLLRGAQVSWQAWLGASASGHEYKWYETARQVDGTNQIATANSVDLAKCLQKLTALQLQVEQVQTTCNSINVGVGSCLTQIASVRDTQIAFRDECYARLYRLIIGVLALLEAFLLPLYRICKADGSSEGSFGEVTIDPELHITNGLGSRASDAVVTSASTEGATVGVHRLSDYGLFYPLIGNNEMYYSDELRQVIARPYRNDGKVYLS